MNIFYTVSCTSINRLDNKIVVITGGNTGIGKATVKNFFIRGARVILACRDLAKAADAIDDIKKQCEDKENLGQLEAVHLDLQSLTSVKACAKQLLQSEEKINILVNNAGIMMSPYMLTEDGYELQFATNYLGHFLFTLSLMPKLIRSTPARIVNVSSEAHKFISSIDFDDLNWSKKKYSPLYAYSQSKLANVLFTKELDSKLKQNKINDVNVYSVHPGCVKTDLGRHVAKQFYIPGLLWLVETATSYIFKTPEQGAQTQIYCSVDEKCANESGLYYSDCKIIKSSAAAQNEEMAKKLWNISLKMVGLEENYNPFK
ncbi:retinol dehydrogenase 12-like [Diorhabda sublineata]|uniref:retinol dehydrogenase 12-like n=1 Tax=Diorhabda sublineata TaxID=1163346 RepID=UPI0024E146E0|nr:retinol dehydrogenase 12-like [Diorhabda sublineata]